jgi:hypothetical protein
MTYAIHGLNPAPFAPLFAMTDAELAAIRATRSVATASHGFPCRVSLEDAREGEELVLLHHTSHAVESPYRSAYAIFVRKDAKPASFVDCLPPVFEGRPLGLRGFDEHGVLREARLALPGEAEARIIDLLANPAIAYIDAHNAAHGCFAARVERHEEPVA